MKRFVAVLALAVPLVALAADTQGTCKFSDLPKLKEHVTHHIKYPASGKDVKEACKKELPDELSKEERACLEAKVKDTSMFKTPDEVLKMLGVAQP
jgi:hypothetical protein